MKQILWKPLWIQLSVAFGAVLLVATIGTGLLVHLMRPEIPTSQFDLSEANRAIFEEFRNRTLLASVMAGTLSALFFGIWMSRRLTKPLSKLVEGTEAISARDLAYRVPVTGNSEFQALARSFNAMAQELESAERLRRNLLSDVAHELRTPLTVLQGNLRAILDDVYTLDKSEVALLYDQTRHLIGLVNDLHELAQAEANQLPLQREPVDLVELTQTAGELFAPLLEQEQIDLRLDTPQQPVWVEADEARLLQVLQNLISNALRHTPPQGEICLRVCARPSGFGDSLPDPHSGPSAPTNHGSAPKSAPQSAQIEVVDWGDGIDAEHLPYVFDRFYRTDNARTRDHGGAGLGLAIVRAMIEAHGGQVQVESQGVGKGATFRVILPKADPIHAPG